MSVAPVLAEHIRQVYLGGNWTAVSLHDTLADVDFALAVREREGLNSIARLVVHLDYYVDVIRGTIAGEPLSGKDADSWLIPLPQNPAAWVALKGEVLAKAEAFATAIETLDDETLYGPFADGKYGTVLRQILGFIEHVHYHLGQLVVLKRLGREASG